MVKKATNLKELRNAFLPDPLTTDKSEYYVDIYSKQIEKLRISILTSESQRETFYIAGQIGTGKSTALNFFPDESIDAAYKIIHINYKDLIDPEDVDFIDVALLFCYELCKENKTLEGKFLKELELLHKVKEKQLERLHTSESIHKLELTEKVDVKVGFKFWDILQSGVSFLQSYRYNKNNRHVTREIFRVREDAVIDLANKIITDYYQEYGSEKKLLVIFDDLEKIRNLAAIKDIFTENSYKFTRIECKKIIAFPFILTGQFGGDTYNAPIVFNIKLNPNPISSSSPSAQEKQIDHNKQLFFSLVHKRCGEDQQLLSEDAISYAIEKSGGLLRQFLTILREAALLSLVHKGSTVSLEDVKKACLEQRAYLSQAIMGAKKINLLATIQKTHKSDTLDAEELHAALLANQVLVYYNGDAWYDVNPISAETVKNYTSEPLQGDDT
ncbi:MAG: hypothetical protein AAF518_01355 [Spirochaetota bacterium]